MRLTELEEIIGNQIKENRNNPEIYNNLYSLIYRFLLRKKVCRSSSDANEIACDMTSDLYFKITKGFDCDHIFGYLEKIYHNYISRFYRSLREVISLDTSDLTKDIIYNRSFTDYEDAINKVYLSDISKVVDHVMENSCKYKIGSKSYENLKISLIISMIRGKEFSFHLDNEQEFYLKLIITNFKNHVLEDKLCPEEIGGCFEYSEL